MSIRKKTSQTKSLRESLFDNTLDGLAYCEMIFDENLLPIDFIYVEVNKNFEKLTGLKDVVGKKITEILPTIRQTSPELLAAFGRVSLSGKSETFEIYVPELDKWFFVSAYSPKKKFFVAIFQNINGRKRIEKSLEDAKIAARNVLDDLQTEKESLARANAKDEALLESIGDGVIATDEKGNIIFINKIAEKLLGKKSSEVMLKDFFDAVPAEDENGIRIQLEQRPLWAAFVRDVTVATNPSIYYRRKDATRFPVAITATPVRLRGKVIGTIEVFRDITKEKAVDLAKTEFVTLASHQLRTPLSSVRWYSEMLLNGDVGKLTEKQHTYVEEIYESNLRMIELVNALLNVSQLEMGSLETKMETVDVKEVIDRVVRDIESRAKKQEVHVLVQAPPALPHLVLDRRLLRMLVENIVVNAIKYTSKKGAVVVAASAVGKGEQFGGHSAHTNSIGIAITDTGIGIPDSQKDRIFTKLFRADNARMMHADGTGLGLYLVKRIAEYSRGEVWFTSQEGTGSAFFVLLPITLLKDDVRGRTSLIGTSVNPQGVVK